MTISLCVIAGNEESIIERMLSSASNCFDELCLVIATGILKPDKTRYVARDWCEKNGKRFRAATYYNQRGDYQHVDDFSAARNMSWDLATSDWQMWLDCDDIIEDPNCERIRKAVEQCTVEMVMCNYRKKDGSACPRERLFKTGTGRWVSVIHETCRLQKGNHVRCDEIEILHAPHSDERVTSHERNYTLLKTQVEDLDRTLFYLHCEQMNLHYYDAAVQIGKAALVLIPDSKPEEKYKVLVNLSTIEQSKTYEYLMEAVKLQPHRREAIAHLAQWCLAAKDLSGAVSFFRMMDALPVPNPVPWTHCAIWYEGGWARNYLRVQLLKAAGKTEQAEKEHNEHLKNPIYAKNVKEFEKAD